MNDAEIHAIAVSVEDGEWFDDTQDMLKFAHLLLEAALKPGDKVAIMQSIVDSNTGFKRDAAPPAQTPPNKAELLCVCGAEWEWENRSWEMVSTPAKTPPPRLTEQEMNEIQRKAGAQFRAHIRGNKPGEPTGVYRMIESAVRAQFGVNDE